MRLARACSLTMALAALPCLADEVRVVSGAPDAVSVTIYRDLFALITETRTVDLPAEPVTLVFGGVVESLLPQSATVAGTGRELSESNYDFEELSPGSLIRRSIGKTVTLTRTHPRTGKVTRVEATIVAANTNGVTFRTVEGNEVYQCSGLPEQLTFEQVPDGIDAGPRLSIRLAGGAAGIRQVRVSYLAHGFAWSADYLGHVDAGAQRMDLLGWVTLRNHTGATFRNAQVQVVAGRLNLLDYQEGGTSLVGDTADFNTDDSLSEHLREEEKFLEDELGYDSTYVEAASGCYPQGPPSFESTTILRQGIGIVDAITAEDLGRFPDGELEEVIVTGIRQSMAVRENLADYQLYRLPVPTDLNARQTKQVAFIRKEDVKVDRFYAVRFADEAFNEDMIEEEGDRLHPMIRIGWTNQQADGLGDPLPAGRVRIFDGRDAGAVFAGEADIRDNPVGAPVEFAIGFARDLTLTPKLPQDEEPQVNWLSLLTRRASLPMEMLIENGKSVPVDVEVRQGEMLELTDIRVKRASLAPERKAGDYMWRITVPANGAAHLSYVVSGRGPDE